mgnify:FL=1
MRLNKKHFKVVADAIGSSTSCGIEAGEVLNCLGTSQAEASRCGPQIKALQFCIRKSGAKGKSKSSIFYHLNRITRSKVR